jgi:hypothetical protein
MSEQLHLIDPSEVSWRLDERTKAVGRQGIAKARAVLAAARVRRGEDATDAPVERRHAA